MKLSVFAIAIGALFGMAMADDLLKRIPVCGELVVLAIIASFAAARTKFSMRMRSLLP